jgi:hypothetical protein
MYKSKFEQKIAKQLEDRGIKFDYEYASYGYILNKKYTPDFFLPNGIIIETKGKFTSEDRRKHLAIKARYPELNIRFVFMRDNPIHKGSKVRYSDWAKSQGYQYAIGEVPEEWIAPWKN